MIDMHTHEQDGTTTLESFVFEIDISDDETRHADEAALVDIATSLRDIILRLAQSGGMLKPNPPNCSFELVVFTKGVQLCRAGGSMESSRSTHSQDDNRLWVEAVGATEQRAVKSGTAGNDSRARACNTPAGLPTLIPIKTMRSSYFSLVVYAKENILSKLAASEFTTNTTDSP
eukprot:SAG31_NODE_205_length_20397_cov_19.191152_6_plen_174_part_00